MADRRHMDDMPFLSIQAQDFIEDGLLGCIGRIGGGFLSIQAQDFIEDAWVWNA